MKKTLIVLLGCFLFTACTTSQVVTVRSKRFSFSKPPALSFEAIFADETDDKTLDAGEIGLLTINIKNGGGRPARGVKVKLTPQVPLKGVDLPNELFVGEIAAGGQKRVQPIKLITKKTTPSQKFVLRLAVEEGLGFSPAEKLLYVDIRNQATMQLIVTSPQNEAALTSVQAQIDGVIIHSLKLTDFRINGASMGQQRGLRIVGTGEKLNIPDTTIFSYKVPLQPGENRLRLEVINSAGEVASRELALGFTPPAVNLALPPPPDPMIWDELRPIRQNQTYAVIIGIADYAEPTIQDLKYTVNDAQAIYGLLTDPRYGGFKPGNVKLLLDKEATVKNIKSAIGNWLPRVTPKDATVIIFFAGHGAPEGEQTYWLTYDADPNDLYSTSLSNDQIADMLSRVQSDRVLTFLDCCYSAATINRTIASRAPVVDDPFKQFKGKGRITITASDGKQQSIEDAQLQHGLFTYRLLEALKGQADRNKDGIVFVGETWDYVSSTVKMDAQFRGYVQQPTFSGNLTDAIPISRNYALALQNAVEQQKEKFLKLYRDQQIDGGLYQKIIEVIEASAEAKPALPNFETKHRAIRDFLDGTITLPTLIRLFR